MGQQYAKNPTRNPIPSDAIDKPILAGVQDRLAGVSCRG